MVEEAIREDDEEEGSGGWKAALLPVVTSLLTAAIVGGGMWYYFQTKLASQRADAKAASEKQIPELPVPAVPAGLADASGDAAAAKHTGIYHQYDPFVVSIFDREKVHYLRIKVALELSHAGMEEEITSKDPQIKDAMIFVLGDFTVRELLDNQAKLLVKDVLLKTLNKILGESRVVDVYFTEFVVQ